MSQITYEKTPPSPAPEHELAKLFPLLDGDARERLRDDIAGNGVLEPIVFLDDHILDGRNRYYIARELGVEYPRVQYEGADAAAFVWSKNGARRHMGDSQLGLIAAKFANLKVGNPSFNSANLQNRPQSSVSQADAAAMVGVSERTVADAAKVLKKGAAGLTSAVEAGKVSISAAASVADLPIAEQADIIAKGEKEIVARAKAIRERQAAERRAKQAENDAARDATRAALSPAVKRSEEAKARNGSRHAAVVETTPAQRIAELEALNDALNAKIEEQAEYIASLEAENAALNADATKWEDMRVQWEQGGFEKVVAGKVEEIRILETRLYRESADKAAWKRSADYWKEEAQKLGWSNDEMIPLDPVDG